MSKVSSQLARNVPLRDIDIQRIVRLSKDGHSAGDIASELKAEKWVVEMVALLMSD